MPWRVPIIGIDSGRKISRKFGNLGHIQRGQNLINAMESFNNRDR